MRLRRPTPLECTLWAVACMVWALADAVPGRSLPGVSRHDTGHVWITSHQVCSAGDLHANAGSQHVAATDHDRGR